MFVFVKKMQKIVVSDRIRYHTSRHLVELMSSHVKKSERLRANSTKFCTMFTTAWHIIRVGSFLPSLTVEFILAGGLQKTNINLVLQGSINFKIPLGQLPIKNREFRMISFYRSQTNRSMQHCSHKILAKFPCSRPATAAQCSLWGRLHLFFSKN